MYTIYLLLGDQGKCIRLWYAEGDAEEILKVARLNLASLGQSLAPPNCVLVQDSRDAPPDMEAYLARTTHVCVSVEGQGDRVVSVREGRADERILGQVKQKNKYKNPQAAHIRACLLADEQAALAEAERDDEFGLEDLMNDPKLLWHE